MSETIKNRTYVSIGGREYGIVSSEPTEYIQKISIELDSRIRQLSDIYFSLTNLDITTLAALNLMDDYVRTRDQLKEVSQEIDGLRSALRDMQIKLQQSQSGDSNIDIESLQKENERLKQENLALKGAAKSIDYKKLAK